VAVVLVVVDFVMVMVGGGGGGDDGWLYGVRGQDSATVAHTFGCFSTRV